MSSTYVSASGDMSNHEVEKSCMNDDVADSEDVQTQTTSTQLYDVDVSVYSNHDDQSLSRTSVAETRSHGQAPPLSNCKTSSSKIFSRLATFVHPLRRTLSRSFNLSRRWSSTDDALLRQFSETIGFQTEILPRRIYDVMSGTITTSGQMTTESLINATYGQSIDNIRFAYDVYDIDADGIISEQDCVLALQTCLKENNVSHIDHVAIKTAVNALLTKLGTENEHTIDYAVFENYVRKTRTAPDRCWQMQVVRHSFSRTGVRKEGVWKWGGNLRFLILNNLQKYCLWLSTAVCCLVCFYWRFGMYANTDKQRLMTWSLPIAKGMGQVMKFCFSVILIPVSRNTITRARNSWLSAVLPFDEAISYHKFIGVIGGITATIHTLCHIADVLSWSDKNRRDLYHQAFPGSEQPTLIELCLTQVSVTGILLYVILCVAYAFALDYPRRWKRLEGTRLSQILNNFNNFWYTHHLFTLFYVLLLIHPRPDLPSEDSEWGVSDFWAWGAVPILLYVFERGLRMYRQASWRTRILYNTAVADDTVMIYLSKPQRFQAKAGMYVFLNCPGIAKFEWHPYTMTSAPQDDHIRVHIANLGDWSAAMYDKFRQPVNEDATLPIPLEDEERLSADSRRSFFERSSTMASTFSLRPELDDAQIFLDGPYGAPCQEFDQFSTLMLIGAGIGITPFASIIRDILSRFDDHRCAHCGKVSLCKSFRIKKVYFIWVVREPQRAMWFNQELYAIKNDDHHDILDIRTFVTGIYPENDIRSMLLHTTQQALFSTSQVDLLTGAEAYVLTKFGRPNWDEIFGEVCQRHPKTLVGVFFCGQFVLSQILEQYCHKYSNKDRTRFEYMFERF